MTFSHKNFKFRAEPETEKNYEKVTDSWPNAVADIVTNFETVDFPNVSMEDKCTALLEILTVIPEEFQTSKMDKNQLRQVRTGIKSGSKLGMALFHHRFWF